MRLRRSFVILCASALALTACERRKAPPGGESARVARTSAADSATRNAVTLWNREAGPALLVASELPQQALVIPPDSAQDASQSPPIAARASATLIDRDGTVQMATIGPPDSGDPCDAWTVISTPPPHAWSIGFIGGTVTPLAMDSIEAATPTDSAALVAAVTRLASALPNDKAGRFFGLPFEVRSAYRFRLPTGQQIAVATLLRQVNQEASPLAEHTLLIAERNTSGRDTTYSMAYVEQSRGAEDTVESTDVLAAVLVGAARIPTLVVTRDFGDDTAFGFIERVGERRWTSKWTSPRRSC